MALSGATSKTYTPKGAYWVWVEWTATQNIANNTSTITAITYAGTNGFGYYTGSNNGSSVTVNGATTSAGDSGDVSANTSKRELCRRTEVVTHNSDGTRSVTISGRWWYSTTFDLTSSGTFTLDTIPRTSSASLSSSNINLGDTITVNITRASTSFTHHIYEDFFAGTWTRVTQSQVATSGTVTIPLSYASRIRNQTSGVGRILVETYSGTTYIGGVVLNFTANVPSSVVPTVGFSITPVSQYSGQYVQGKSRLTVGFTGGGALGSSIVSRSTNVKSGATVIHSSTTSSFTTNVINYSGTITLETTATDSRGRTASATTTVSFVAYTNPSITSFSAFRCDANGTLNPKGLFIKLQGTGTISPINGTNTKTIKLRYKVRGAATWQEPSSSPNYSATLSVVVAADANTSYETQMYVADFYTSVTQATNIGTAFSLINYHASGNYVAFGKSSEGLALIEVGGDIKADGQVYKGDIPLSFAGIPSANAIDTTITAGRYRYSTVAAIGTFGVLDVCVSSAETYNGVNNWIWQTAYATNGRIYQRMRINAGAWTGWKEIFTTDIFNPSNYSLTSHTHSEFVPTGRTVNGRALTANISLTASDVGAAASSHTHPYQQLSNVAHGLTGTVTNATWTAVSYGKTFGVIPTVVATGVSNVAGESFPKVRNRSTTGFEIIVGGTGASNAFNWIAIVVG